MKANDFRRLRLGHKLTVTEVAEILGLSKGYVSLLENGKRPITKKLERKIGNKLKNTPSTGLGEVAKEKLINLMDEIDVDPALMIIVLEKMKRLQPIPSFEFRFKEKLEREFSKMDSDFRKEFKETLIEDLVQEYTDIVRTVFALYLKCRMNKLYFESNQRDEELNKEFWILSSSLWPDHPGTKINETIRYMDSLIYSRIVNPFDVHHRRDSLDQLLNREMYITKKYIIPFEGNESLELHSKWSKMDIEYPWVYMFYTFYEVLKKNVKHKGDVRKDTLLYIACAISKISEISEPDLITKGTYFLKLSNISYKKLSKPNNVGLTSPLKASVQKTVRSLDGYLKKVTPSFIQEVTSLQSKKTE